MLPVLCGIWGLNFLFHHCLQAAILTVHALHLHFACIFVYQTPCQKLEKADCVGSVKMTMTLHCTHTLWNTVIVGDMAMAYFLELFPITVMHFLVVVFHIRATSSPLSTECSCVHESNCSVRNTTEFTLAYRHEVTGTT